MTMVDTGGHWKYTKNTLSGMSQCNIGVVVINANKHDYALHFRRLKELIRCAAAFGIKDIVLVVN